MFYIYGFINQGGLSELTKNKNKKTWSINQQLKLYYVLVCIIIQYITVS